MEEQIERLNNRVAVLEEMVECLLGKAFADSGQMVLLIEDIVEMNGAKPPVSTEPFVIASHDHLNEHLRYRLAGGHFRSSYFPRKWKTARRLRETEDAP